ncbi:sugar-phosphate dehydrogenase [marine gamma proteobacterium HTCC2143]|uniref:Sugar-phosphate dehydrogenase n=1 Tax=marine gamma proteobacterium HTCC2143 TaxID=247633 RepID=A0YA12_9GAMM|nr:sugar-phosphate dehydrogenase [marine gamma proteobacterium HTCC2143]
MVEGSASIGKKNALFVATQPYPPEVRQCRKAAEATGKWLAEDTSRRDRLVLVTKVHEPMSDDVNDRGLSARHIQLACDASLRRLGVDHIDLYQMHHIDRLAPIEEIW